MITRLVKMTFKEEYVEDFKTIFLSNCDLIRGSEGCNHLQFWQDIKNPSIFFTYSIWEKEEDLNNYRHSDLFKKVWSKTKVLFREKPEAWSVNKLKELN